jgi:tetratricopeptide (TPR) repeat protein
LRRREDASAASREAQQLWRELNNLPMLSDSLATAAEITVLRGEIQEALDSALEGLRVSQSIHNLWGEAYNLFTIGMAYLEQGNLDAGLTALKTCIERSDQAQFLAGGLTGRVILAWVYLTLGAPELAAEIGEQLSKFTQLNEGGERQHTIWQAFAVAHTFWQAHLALHNGEIEQAEAFLHKIGDLDAVQENELYYAPMVGLLYVQVALEKKDHEQALELSRKLEAKMRSAGYGMLLSDVVQSKGRALAGLGRAAEAYQILLVAREIAIQQGSRRSLYSILIDLLRIASESGEPLPLEEGSAGGEETVRAAALQAEAREAIEFILAHISDPQLRANFLGRPGVRAILEDLPEKPTP